METYFLCKAVDYTQQTLSSRPYLSLFVDESEDLAFVAR